MKLTKIKSKLYKSPDFRVKSGLFLFMARLTTDGEKFCEAKSKNSLTRNSQTNTYARSSVGGST